MIDPAAHKRMQATIAKKIQEINQATGAVAEMMRRLRDDFGCDTLGEAEAYAVELERTAADSEQQYNAALTQFKKDFPDVLS